MWNKGTVTSERLVEKEWNFVGIHVIKRVLYDSFNQLVAWKQGLSRQKLSFKNLSPSHTLSFTISKTSKQVFSTQN